MEKKIIVLGKIRDSGKNTFDMSNRVYDKSKLSPTIMLCSGGAIPHKVIRKWESK